MGKAQKPKVEQNKTEVESLLDEALAALKLCIESNELPLRAETAALEVLRKADRI